MMQPAQLNQQVQQVQQQIVQQPMTLQQQQHASLNFQQSSVDPGATGSQMAEAVEGSSASSGAKVENGE